MSEALTADFPFVAELPKRQQSRMANFWEKFSELQTAVQSNGAIVPVSFASKLLNVGTQRVYTLISEGSLLTIEIDGHVFVTGGSLAEYAKTERKRGRPRKGVETKLGVLKASVAYAREMTAAK